MFTSFLASKEKKAATLFFCAYFLVYLAINLFSGTKNLLADTLYVFSALIAFLAGIYTVNFYGINNPRGRALIYISSGLLLWFIAEATWVFLDFFSPIKPYPSIADAFFILAYPLFFIGLAKEAKIGKINWKPERIMSLAPLTSVLGLAVFYFGVYTAYDPGQDAISNLFSIFYGIGDLILLLIGTMSLFIILDYRKGKLFVPWIMIMLGFFSILVADIVFSIYENSYIDGNSSIIKIDILWTSGYLLIGYGLTLIALSLKEMRSKLIELLSNKKRPIKKPAGR